MNTEAVVDAFDLPTSTACQAALRLVVETGPEYLANHCVRTYVLGRAFADRHGMDHDDALLFLGCVLHDLGLTAKAGHDQRFEVDGADVAAAFLREQGVAEDHVEIVWDAVALHTSPGIAARKRPEIALVHIGSGMDVFGPRPSALTERLDQHLPRLDVDSEILATVAGQIAAHPRKAPPFSFPDAVAAELLPHHTRLSLRDLARHGMPIA